MGKKRIPAGVKAAAAIILGAVLLIPLFRSRQESEPVDEAAYAQDYSDDINVDIITRHCLPSLTRMAEEDREKYVDPLQVMKKFDALGLNEDTVLHPEKNYEETKNGIEDTGQRIIDEDENGEKVEFYGNTGAEMQDFINANQGKVIEIRSGTVQLDRGIDIPSNTSIRGNNALLECNELPYAFKSEDASDIVIRSVELTGSSEYGIVLSHVSGCVVTGCSIHGMKQKAVTIVNSSDHILVSDSDIYENSAGGIYISDGSSYVEIAGNTVSGNTGTSNWMAGVVITSCSSENALEIWEKFDENRHFPYKLDLYSDPAYPNHILIEKNTVQGNQSSGIYVDGGYSSFVINNNVIDNDKEGMCLDYGAIGFYVADNLFMGNGCRKHQSDKDLEMDFVLGGGREGDGSAKSKLPAISIDNAAYNIVADNVIRNNAGGGVKMVRTGIRNLIMENVIKDNNHENDAYHFFGIEIGSAGSDSENTHMDFTPGYENIICRNTISGKHWSGVFIGEGGYVNDVFDNVIMEPEYFAVESVGMKYNSIVNNVSNMSIRNEYRK